MDDLTKAIKKAMIDKGYNVIMLAAAIGKSRIWTGNCINGHCRSDDTIRKIAKVLGLNLTKQLTIKRR